VSSDSTKARRSARRRVFVADPPLASLVDDAVAQLKIHRQYPTHRRRNRGLFSVFGLAIGSSQCIARRALERPPWRRLTGRSGRAGRRVLHPRPSGRLCRRAGRGVGRPKLGASPTRVLQVSPEEQFHFSDAVLPGVGIPADHGAPPLPCLRHPRDGRIRVEAVKGSRIDLDADGVPLLLSPLGQRWHAPTASSRPVPR
jgi:hypothetical protein